MRRSAVRLALLVAVIAASAGSWPGAAAAQQPGAGEAETPAASEDALADAVQIVGYWDEGWEVVTPPEGANLAITFLGDSDFEAAVEGSAKLLPRMEGRRFLGLGGGNQTGGWSAEILAEAAADLAAGKVVGYHGVAFDVEECRGTGLADDFAHAFEAAQEAGLEVLVTVSHSEPFGCEDAGDLMTAFLADPDIDWISPQLYTTGEETENDFTARGTPWSAYADAVPVVVPSLVRASMYPAARRYFAAHGVELGGFVEWRGPGN